MPSDFSSPINSQTFFKFWATEAFTKESKLKLNYCNLLKARIAAIAFGIFTLGIGTLISRVCLHDRKVISASQTKKFYEARVKKIFAGSSDKRKIKEIKRIEGEMWEAQQSIIGRIDDQLSKYTFINKLNKNTYKLILKNESKFNRYSCFLSYAHTQKMAELLNQDHENHKEEIQTLQKKLSIGGIGLNYMPILFSHADFEKIACHVLEGNKIFKETFLSFLSTLDFSEFKEKYDAFKDIALQKGKQNFFLSPPGDDESSTRYQTRYHPALLYVVNLLNKCKAMAYACEVLDALTFETKERTEKLATLRNMIRPITPENQCLLWKLLALHCEIKDIPVLINFRFGFRQEDETLRTHFFPNLANPSNENKWHAALPFVWQHYDALRLGSRNLHNILESLNTKERFQRAFQTLCDSAVQNKDDLLSQCVDHNILIRNPLPVSERIETVKNIFLPQIIEWAATEDPEQWYVLPFNYETVMGGQDEYFTNARQSLSQLLLQINEPSPSTLRVQASEDIANLIEAIKQLNEKSRVFLGTNLIEGVERLEGLTATRENWERLKGLLEMAVFDAVARSRPFRLFS